MSSWDASIRNPENELVHLWDIWEGVKTELGGEEDAKAKLSISTNRRKRFGCISNNLRQGRHRGKQVEQLRDATELELDFARCFAHDVIVGYLEYLEAGKS